MMPDLPTLHESGLSGFDRTAWYGVAAPAGVPREVVQRLNALVGKAVNMPEAKRAFEHQGLEARTATPEEFAAFIRDEIEQNIKLVKAANIKIE
jgi:tripartite-type tricarboxylate transporter receptor subunit TctC